MKELQFGKMDSDLCGHGVVIDTKNGFIYRLAVSPMGKDRVAMNQFDYEANTVLGPAIQMWDFDTSEGAIAKFQEFKTRDDLLWREDDRVFYQFQSSP